MMEPFNYEEQKENDKIVCFYWIEMSIFQSN